MTIIFGVANVLLLAILLGLFMVQQKVGKVLQIFGNYVGIM